MSDCEELVGGFTGDDVADLARRISVWSGFSSTQSELYFRMKREVQSSIRVTPMPKLNREPPPRWRSPDSQVATASSVLYLAQSGWLMTPALLMTGSTDVQPVCSSPIVKIRNRIRISTYQIRLCVNWFKVLQQVYVSLIVHLIVPLFFQRVVKEKLICNTNFFFTRIGRFVEGVWLWRISGGYSQETVLVLGQNLPTVQSYISSASNVTRN